MATDQYTKVGTIVKYHGLKGAVKASLSNYLKNIEAIRCFFIAQGESYLPYFVEQISPLPPKFHFLKLEGLNSKEDAMDLGGIDLYLDKDVLENHLEVANVDGPFVHLVGFRLLDQSESEIGVIDDIVDLPEHYLAQIFVDGKEILIPLHEETIIETRGDKKQVLVDIPEGLIELYIPNFPTCELMS